MSRHLAPPELTDPERRTRAYSDLLRLRAAEDAIRAARQLGSDVSPDWDDLPSTP